MFKLICVTWALMIHYRGSMSQTSKIDQTLAQRLQNGEKVNVVVTFTNGVKSTIETVKSLRHGDRSARNNAIVEALRHNAETSQQNVVQALSTRSEGEGLTYFRSFWTSNKLFIREADQTTIDSIAEDPQVDQIRIASNSKLPKTKDTDESERVVRSDPDEYPYWNLDRMQVNQTYDELGGSKGEGVIIGAIDSGVQVTHDQLKDSYRGEYGWYDGTNGTLEPYDFFGHGTLVLGIIVGKNTGIAPGVNWMMCQACAGMTEGDECHFEAIMNCIQFMSCPTLPDGSQQDCSKAPHVVNFSIGGEREGEPYDEDFFTMKELGIITVAAIGNSGPKCMTDETPANKPYTIAVGASKWNNEVWVKSSFGPTPDGRIKPDFVAPGYFIWSSIADSEGDNFRDICIGTSCAAPHVTAIIALLHVRNPDISFEEVYDFLKLGAHPNCTVSRYQQRLCNNTFDVVPNNFFGYGWVSALDSIRAQSETIATRKL